MSQDAQTPSPLPSSPPPLPSTEEVEELEPATPSIFWRPLQKLRAKLHLVPSAEVEVLANLVIAQQYQIQILHARIVRANANFKGIAEFIELTGKNTQNMDTNARMMLERIRAIEKVLRLRQDDEPDDGTYVQ